MNDDQLVLSRATALRELGAAVSLDPTNADALGLIVHAVTAPGVSLPDEARRALADKAARRMRTFAQSVWKSWAVWAALSLCFFWIGSPHPALLVALFSAMVLLILLGAHVARTGIQRPWEYWTLNAGTLVLTVLCSFFFGTYFFSVGLATATALYATSVYPSRTERARAVYWAVAAVGISLALGWSGWVPSNLQFLEGAIVVRPAMIHFPKPWTEVIMATTALFWLVAVTGPSRALVDSKFADEEKLAMQAWLFRNLLPEPADRSAPPDGVGAEPSSLRMP